MRSPLSPPRVNDTAKRRADARDVLPPEPLDLHSPPELRPNFIVIVQVFLPSAVADDVGVVACLAASEDGRRAFAGVEDGSVVVVDAATGVAASRVVAFPTNPSSPSTSSPRDPLPPTTPSGTSWGATRDEAEASGR